MHVQHTRLLAVGFALIAALLIPPRHAQAANAATVESSQRILVMLRLPPPHYRPASGYGRYEDAPGHQARRRVAAQLAREHGLRLESDWPMPLLGVDCYVLRVPPGQSVSAILSGLKQDSRAQWAQPMNTFHGLARPDALYALQPSARLWHLRELHARSTGRGVRIAIIDSGVDAAHPGLSGRVAIARDFVDAGATVAESHGTAVAGIISARAAVGYGIVGIAPQARLLALRACWEASPGNTLCNSFTLAKALQFAIGQRADVINLSLGGPQDELLARLLDVARERGITTVAAVDPQAPDGGFPASHAGVLAVGDVAEPALRLPVLLAPGKDIPATLPGGRYGFVSGTSFAAAQVTGLVALVKQLAHKAPMSNPTAWVVFSTSAPGSSGMVDACGTLHRQVPTFTCEEATAQARDVAP